MTKKASRSVPSSRQVASFQELLAPVQALWADASQPHNLTLLRKVGSAARKAGLTVKLHNGFTFWGIMITPKGLRQGIPILSKILTVGRLKPSRPLHRLVVAIAAVPPHLRNLTSARLVDAQGMEICPAMIMPLTEFSVETVCQRLDDVAMAAIADNGETIC